VFSKDITGSLLAVSTQITQSF